jgi:hypothetical protein
LRWRRVPSTSGSGIRSQRFRYCEAALIDLILCRTKPHFAFGINEAGIGPLIVPSTGPARTANASHEPCNRYWPTPALALPAAGRGQCRDDERTAAFFNEKKSRIGGRPPSPANQIPPQGSTGLGWCFSIVQHNRDLCIVGKPRWVGHRHAAPGGIHILPGKPWGYAKWLLARSGRLQGIPESEGRHRFSRPGIFSPEGLHRSSSLAAKRDRIPEKRKAASLT